MSDWGWLANLESCACAAPAPLRTLRARAARAPRAGRRLPCSASPCSRGALRRGLLSQRSSFRHFSLRSVRPLAQGSEVASGSFLRLRTAVGPVGMLCWAALGSFP